MTQRLLFACTVSFFAAILLGGCSEGSSFVRPPDYTSVDSAGITVVENMRINSRFLDIWSIEERPALVFGGKSDSSAEGRVDIKHLVLLQSGMVVAITGAGQSAYQFEFYDQDGKHIATHGQRGDSAGSFRSVSAASAAGGDTVVAIDAGSHRIVWVSASGGVVRSHELDERMIKRILGPDAAGIPGSLVPVNAAVYAVRVRRGSTNPENPRQSTISFQLVDVDRGLARKLPSFDEAAPREFSFSSGPAYMSTVVEPVRGNVVVTPPAVRRSAGDTSAAATAGRACVVVSGRAEIECVDADDHRTLIRWPVDSVKYTDSDRKNHEARLLNALDKMPSFSAADREKLVTAQEYPAYFHPLNMLAVDSDGNLWLHENAVSGRGERYSRFRVFGKSGQQIAFADGFETTGFGTSGGTGMTVAIGTNAVFRKLTDSTGASRIGKFAIRKGR